MHIFYQYVALWIQIVVVLGYVQLAGACFKACKQCHADLMIVMLSGAQL